MPPSHDLRDREPLTHYVVAEKVAKWMIHEELISQPDLMQLLQGRGEHPILNSLYVQMASWLKDYWRQIFHYGLRSTATNTRYTVAYVTLIDQQGQLRHVAATDLIEGGEFECRAY